MFTLDRALLLNNNRKVFLSMCSSTFFVRYTKKGDLVLMYLLYILQGSYK